MLIARSIGLGTVSRKCFLLKRQRADAHVDSREAATCSGAGTQPLTLCVRLPQRPKMRSTALRLWAQAAVSGVPSWSRVN